MGRVNKESRIKGSNVFSFENNENVKNLNREPWDPGNQNKHGSPNQTMVFMLVVLLYKNKYTKEYIRIYEIV